MLKPFEQATEFTQIEKFPSSGYVLPCITGIEKALNDMHSIHNVHFLETMKVSLKHRMNIYRASETYTVAAVLDPRFKLCWCTSDEEKQLANYKSKVLKLVNDCPHDQSSMSEHNSR